MSIRTITTIAIVCGFLMPLASAFGAAKVISGMVAASPAGAASVQVRVNGKVISIKRGNNAVITRGATGEKGRPVPLREFIAGDAIIATVEHGEATSLRAFYSAPKPLAKPSPKLKINSITFSAPVPLKPGDIITVDLTGNPRANAAFSVKGLISMVKMQEFSPGAYHGAVKVPKGRTVRNAPLTGYLGYQGARAAPVQASRLVTILESPEETMHPTAPVKPAPPSISEPDRLPTVKPEPPPEKPVRHDPVPAPTLSPPPVAPPAMLPESRPAPMPHNKIVITSIVDGGVVQRAITVTGAADPNSVVRVEITYSNQLSGVLRLAGEVVSQNLSCGKNGEFRIGPIALDGPLTTDGLKFTIKAHYLNRPDHGTVEVSVTGKED